MVRVVKMVKRMSYGERLFSLINSAFMVLFMLLCLYPIIHVLLASISDPVRLVQHRGFLLWPLGFTLKGYVLVFRNPNIMTGYSNTLFYVLAGTMINLATFY